MVDNHCIRTTHAEVNAVAHAAKLGISLSGGVAYCTYKPCFACLKTLVAAGVTAMIYDIDYAGSVIPDGYLNKGDIYFKSLKEMEVV